MEFEKRLRQFESHTGSTEVLAWVAAAGLIGIEDGQRFGNAEGGFRQMVISDDQVQPQSLCRFRRGEGADSGIHADNQADTFPGCRFEDLSLHSVAFTKAVRDVKTGSASESLDCSFQQHNGRGAIHVIVAVDKDRLLSGDGALNSLDCGAHAEHEIRVVQMVKAGVEESGGVGTGADTTRNQQQSQER